MATNNSLAKIKDQLKCCLLLLVTTSMLVTYLSQRADGSVQANQNKADHAVEDKSIPSEIRSLADKAERAYINGESKLAMRLQRQVMNWINKQLPKHHYFRAKNLEFLALIQSADAQSTEALDSAREAVNILRTFNNNSPGTRLDLAEALRLNGVLAAMLGQWPEAIATTNESISISRGLGQSSKDAKKNLSGSLKNIGAYYFQQGRVNEALFPSLEALKILRELVQEDPQYQSDLASTLMNLSEIYEELGKMRTSLSCAKEGVQIYQRLIQQSPFLQASLSRAVLRQKSLTSKQPIAGVPAAAPEAVRQFISLYKSGNISGAVDALMRSLIESIKKKENSYSNNDIKETIDGLEFLRDSIVSTLKNQGEDLGSLKDIVIIHSILQKDGIFRVHLKASYSKSDLYFRLLLEKTTEGMLFKDFAIADHDVTDD